MDSAIANCYILRRSQKPEVNMNPSYEQYWAACDPYDAFLSKEEKEKYETEVLANHPEYLERLNSSDNTREN